MSGTELRFYAEYQCYPLWVTKPEGGEDNLDPADLGVDPALAQSIVQWSDDFDALFDPDDFGAPLFTDPAAESAFGERGRVLATELAAALGDRYSVVFHWLGGEHLRLS